MKTMEFTDEFKDLFDEDFTMLVYGFFGGIWIMIGYMAIQLIGVFI